MKGRRKLLGMWKEQNVVDKKNEEEKNFGAWNNRRTRAKDEVATFL